MSRQVIIYAPKGPAGEPWDWRSPAATGIGGSETAVIEMSRRLAARGYRGVVYAPIAKPDQDPVSGWEWLTADEVEFTRPALWLCHRAAAAGELLHGQRAIHVTHDMDPPEEWTPERVAGFERILCLSRAQLRHYRETWPFMAGKLALWSNGIDAAGFDAGDRAAPPRDPKRLIYSSSPDRGLVALLHIFRRAYEIDDGLSLDIYYGWSANWPWPDLKTEIERLADHPGVFWHGRVPQPDLHEAFRRSALWVYPTHFTESSAITCMEAQALGAIPVTRPFWALGENVRWGTFIEGDPSDYLTRARYVEEILRLAAAPEEQKEIRSRMMGWAREYFGWERQIDWLEGYMGGEPWMDFPENRLAAREAVAA